MLGRCRALWPSSQHRRHVAPWYNHFCPVIHSSGRGLRHGHPLRLPPTLLFGWRVIAGAGGGAADDIHRARVIPHVLGTSVLHFEPHTCTCPKPSPHIHMADAVDPVDLSMRLTGFIMGTHRVNVQGSSGFFFSRMSRCVCVCVCFHLSCFVDASFVVLPHEPETAHHGLTPWLR